jgi:ribosomal protein L11 methyltransferase
MMFELGLVCPESCVQDISEALEALDALSVSVEDADAMSEAEQALFGEPGMPPPKEAWQSSKVVALFAKEVAAQDAERLLSVQDFFTNCQSLGGSRSPNRNFSPLKLPLTFGSFPLGTNLLRKPSGLSVWTQV